LAAAPGCGPNIQPLHLALRCFHLESEPIGMEGWTCSQTSYRGIFIINWYDM
jgi:hypothetical protein